VLASGRTSGTGYYFLAIDPSIIRPLDEMKRDLDEYFLTIKNSPRREGVDEIFLPGEIEHKIAADRKNNGYMLLEAVANEALGVFKKYKAIHEGATIEDLFKE
jgi:LDH2 family malate/lactate/ureidoglycolate dehydrogenase